MHYKHACLHSGPELLKPHSITKRTHIRTSELSHPITQGTWEIGVYSAIKPGEGFLPSFFAIFKRKRKDAFDMLREKYAPAEKQIENYMNAFDSLCIILNETELPFGVPPP